MASSNCDSVKPTGVVYPRKLHLAERVFAYGESYRVFMAVLMEIHGMTAAKAVAIGDVYPTMGSLVREYRSLSEEESASLLKNLRAFDTGKALGFRLSFEVYFALYGNDGDGSELMLVNNEPVPLEWCKKDSVLDQFF